MGLKHGPGTRVRSTMEKERAPTGIGSRVVERGKEGSVCNSPWRWCETMRCDRSAMSCGRPDGPAAVPAARRSTPTMSIPDPVTAYAYSRVTTTNIRRGRSKRKISRILIMAGKKRKDRRSNVISR